MKRTIIKSVILMVVFVVALFTVSSIMNQGNTDMTTEMGEATLPTLSMRLGAYEVNSLHGYTKEMETASLRDTLLPVDNDRKVVVRMKTYGITVDDIAFEVRSVDGKRLVESTKVTEYERNEEEIAFTITLKDLIDADTEYMLVFLVTPENGKEIRYYTRLVQSEDLYVNEKLAYIMDFHERTFDKEAAAELTKYLESNSEGDNTTFHQVNIHSSFQQVTWGDLSIHKVTEPVVSIKELAEQTGSFQLEYLASVREGKESSTYRIREYYRVRYTKDRMYLLDYNREMEQIFDEKADVFVNDKIVLGIVGDDVTLQESDGGNVFAFVVADKLYSYNVTDNKLARLYSFYGNTEELLDDRCRYNQHDIQILTVDETGNVAFLVYGYMNRGRHEGEVGVAVYYYNSMTNTVEEKIYLPYTKSYSLLKAEMQELSYLNKDGIYYFMLNETVYAVDLEKESYQVIESGLREGGYHISDSHKMLVWQDGDDIYASTSVTLMNLNTQQLTTIQAGVGEYISVLGFMDEDLIYGVARQYEVTKDSTGATIFPMYCVKIQNDDGDVLKSYQKSGVYIVDGQIEDNQIRLSRVTWNEDTESYETVSDDQIMSTGQTVAGSNTLCQAVTDLYETITQIAVKQDIDSNSLIHLTPKEVLFEGSRNLLIDEQTSAVKRYYVYGQDGIESIGENPGKAVELAYQISGVVVDDNGAYVWRKGNRSTRNQIMAITEDTATEERSSVAVCLDTILKYEGVSRNTQQQLTRGESVLSILENALTNDTILDLSGCTLDAVLYYVNMDIPVFASLEDGNAVLIVGFNELNIVVMEPETGTLYKKGMNDSKEWLEENGNHFITYMRNAG